MKAEEQYITITHINDFSDFSFFRPGQVFSLRKDTNNPYDDEAIAVYREDVKYGYVANCVDTVARGTLSAGRIYEHIQDGCNCTVRFVMEDRLIAEINSD